MLPSRRVLEQWQTFEWDPALWVDLLDEIGADENARRDLFLLSQIRKEDANDIVWKIVKKMTDGDHLVNASAFIHSSCKNVRHASRAYT